MRHTMDGTSETDGDEGFEWSGVERGADRWHSGSRRTRVLLLAGCVAGVCLLAVSVQFVHLAPHRVELGSLMSEFSPYAQSPDVATGGEMKASSNFYSDEGAAPKGPTQVGF